MEPQTRREYNSLLAIQENLILLSSNIEVMGQDSINPYGTVTFLRLLSTVFSVLLISWVGNVKLDTYGVFMMRHKRC